MRRDRYTRRQAGALPLAAVALLLASACGGAPPSAAPQNAEAGAPTESSSALASAPSGSSAADSPSSLEAMTAPWKGDFDGMLERRLIRALVPYGKTFYFVDEGGAQRGISYEYMKAFEDDLNARRKSGTLPFHVVFLPTTRDRMLELLDSGRGDVAALDATISAERLAQADFTAPIASGIREVVVTGPASPPIANLDDLAGKTVFVRPASTREAHLRELSAALEARGLPPIDVRLAPAELEPEDLLEMTSAGLLPAVVVNRFYGSFWKQILPGLVVRDDLAVSDGVEVGFAMRKGSPKLKAELDRFLAARKRGTEFGNVTVQRYLQNTKWVKNAASEAELAKYRQVVDLFRKYSEKYGVDWLLMVAQGYQESRLDQNVKSSVGAIGVMQVMPATGKELAVGDITELESNIHAGIKYVRGVVDRYFATEPMDDRNRLLFAIAAYNAGPARVRSLREEAARRGLDPDVWFNNVEHVASERVGRETVQYVSNIYKYHVAYTLVNEQAAARRDARSASRPAN